MSSNNLHRASEILRTALAILEKLAVIYTAFMVTIWVQERVGLPLWYIIIVFSGLLGIAVIIAVWKQPKES